MNGTQRQVLLTTCLTHGLIHVYELSVPALLILIQSKGYRYMMPSCKKLTG